MTPARIRFGLHLVYAFAVLVKVASGLLLTEPDLRAKLVGGYGREIMDIHLWSGWVFLGAPLLALALAARPLLRDLRRRLERPDGITWRKIHIVVTLSAGIILSLTGVLLWPDLELPHAFADLMLEVHDLLIWAVIAALSAHLIAARRKILLRTRRILGL
ncbi:MAG: cytochrome b/b6 domain-containing protein [Deltaproteobacteria bacterium]|nr:cytochrome b/b6 domain-containing protein [Deltaproteobacteria bacterium]